MKHGFASATIARVAKRAGLAKGTLYLYFKTKEELFTGVVRDFVISPLWGTENQSIQDNERVGDFFRRTILPVVRDIESGNRAAVARLVLAESSKFPFLAEVYRKEAYEPFLKHISVFAKLAYKRGEIADDSLVHRPHLLAAPLWIGIAHNGSIDPEHPIDIGSLFEAQLDVLFGRASMIHTRKAN